MERNISHMWSNSGNVLAGEMLGKAVRSIFEQESSLVHVTTNYKSIHENLDTKLNVTVSKDEAKYVKQKFNPKSPKELELKHSYIEVNPINSVHRKEAYNLRTIMMIILTSTGGIVGVLLITALIIKLVIILFRC